MRCLAAWSIVLLAGCSGSGDASRPPLEALEPSTAASPPRDVAVVPRTPELATFPCAEQCHADRAPNPTPRPLTEFHTTVTLDHGPAATWCAFCHRVEDADTLRLISDEVVPFDASDRVCGQCHGEKHRDWVGGIHGLDTGSWNGSIRRRTCTACHDPHAPGPLTLEALPAPAHANDRLDGALVPQARPHAREGSH